MASADASQAARSGTPDAAELRDETASDSGVRSRHPGIEEVYQAEFDFVWRTARRLGVADAFVDDVVQETFLVVQRRLPSFEARSSLRTWLFAVVAGVARNHRRSVRRQTNVIDASAQQEEEPSSDRPSRPGPHATAERAEAVRILYEILDGMQEERREVFILAELEQMSGPEIAEALGIKENTVYSRLRGARQDFDQAVARKRAQDTWRFG